MEKKINFYLKQFFFSFTFPDKRKQTDSVQVATERTAETLYSFFSFA